MFIADAGCVIVITAVYDRTTWRYGERGVRYVHIEVGHAAQNIHLQAVALGLGSVPIGAFHDDKIVTILDLEENECPIYIIPVGHTK
jgi:SagB-type dehydrogenase family enzyme